MFEFLPSQSGNSIECDKEGIDEHDGERLENHSPEHKKNSYIKKLDRSVNENEKEFI